MSDPVDPMQKLHDWRNELGFRYNQSKKHVARCEDAMKQARWAIALQLSRWRDGDSVCAVTELQNAHDALCDLVGEAKPEEKRN